MPVQKKIIIALFGKQNSGKTTTLNLLIYELRQHYPAYVFAFDSLPDTDKVVIVDINGVAVGISTRGDDGSDVDHNLRWLHERNCTLLVTATRTQGSTVNVVEQFATEANYHIDWIEKAHCYKSDIVPETLMLARYEAANALNLTLLLEAIDYYLALKKVPSQTRNV